MLAKTNEEPSEGRMKLIALGIKMCALNAKLEENEYGEYFRPDDEPSGVQKRSNGAKPAGGGRKDAGSTDA